MVVRTCHHAVGGPRRDRAVEVPREHRRGPDSGTAAGWSDHYAGQPADPDQGDDHPGDRTRRLLCLRRGLLCARAHPRHRPGCGRGPGAADPGVRLQPRHAAGQCRCRRARACCPPPDQGAPPAELGRCAAGRARGGHRPGRLSSGGISARWPRNGRRPHAGRRASGRPQAPGRDEHGCAACRGPWLTRRGDLPDGGERTVLGRPHHDRAARRSSRASSTRVPRKPGRNGGQSPCGSATPARSR